MRVALLCYDMPHWKSQQLLLAMTAKGYRPEMAISFAPVPMEVPQSLVKPRHVGVLHPHEICRALGILYIAPMPIEEMVSVLKWATIDVALIGGSKMLPRAVWEACKMGIINLHPGMIPQARGLDCIRWSVYYDIPLGVSAHFIDERVDAGRLILRQEIPLYHDDSWLSIRLRLDETQVDLATDVLKLVQDSKLADFPVVETSTPAFRYMPEKEVSELALEDYLRRRGR